ncbi:MAG: oxygen-dependent coproporphyrinogen oxidase [Planctomycetes bacterium]|nr:oxygen-dependent coproporphyrinogen oxidase [Planctomycetota bacterium]
MSEGTPRARYLAWFRDLQDRLCTAFEAIDGGARFREDTWEREGGGGGRSRVLEKGSVFEKAGVNVSEVHGTFPDDLAASLPGEGLQFFAAGVSLVVHPRSPMVPTVHMNVRRIERASGGWFGGGADLTPYVLFEEDARHFHRVLRDAVEPYEEGAHARFKAECDRYFHLPHRGEARGIGGVFFDYLSDREEATFELVQRVGNAFFDAYLPIVEARRDEPFDEAHELWQLQRRGRYVEFNLVHDRGTIFGLKTRGRTESILMSLPPRVRWDYDVQPAPGSFGAALVDVLRNPRDWLP